MCNGQFTVILRPHVNLPFQQIITLRWHELFFFLSAGVFNVDAPNLEMTICPRHRELFGSRWQSGRSIFSIPDEIAAHKSSSAKGLCGLFVE